MGTELALVDGIGPFFQGIKKQRINWSKIPFGLLPSDEGGQEVWEKIKEELGEFLDQVQREGFTAVTLDDVGHLTSHPWYEPEVQEKISFWHQQFRGFFAMVKERGLGLYVTSDVITKTEAIDLRTGGDKDRLKSFYLSILETFLTENPEVDGLILRLGESDGLDVKDELNSELFLKSSKDANAFLKEILPLLDQHETQLILRTWTVGAHRIGDLIWHQGRLSSLVEGITSENFILSMKPGDSDFFRHLPMGKGFFSYSGKKILELQARPEYEGGGELPTFLGSEFSRYAQELEEVENLVGFSVWCQTGGWHRFRRKSFIGKGSPWVEVNSRLAIDLFKNDLSVEDSLERQGLGKERELLELVDHLVRNLYYIRPFAEQEFFFRRVRIPPLAHVYWDTIFVIAPVRKLLRFFVDDHQAALRDGEAAAAQLPRLQDLSKNSPLPKDDLDFFCDTLRIIQLTRRYFFTYYDEEVIEQIAEAKKAYKEKWPLKKRSRFRIRTDFRPFHLKRRTLGWGTRLLLRNRRGYRLVDYAFSLTVLSWGYHLFRRNQPKAMPKFLRKSAMGVDTLFR